MAARGRHLGVTQLFKILRGLVSKNEEEEEEEDEDEDEDEGVRILR